MPPKVDRFQLPREHKRIDRGMNLRLRVLFCRYYKLKGGEPIQDDFCYEFNDEVICEQCLNDNHRKMVDDYVE